MRLFVITSVIALLPTTVLSLTRRGVCVGAGAASCLLRGPAPLAAFTEEDYLRSPADISAAFLPAFSQRDVFLHFHGRGGPDREDGALEARVKAQDGAVGFDRFVHVFVWREWLEAASTETISFTGQAIGRKLGQELAARREPLRSLHVCGTSAGAFAANECIAAYVAAAGDGRATTRLTLCDPFCARSDEVGAPWDDGRRTSGARLFGRDADFAEQFLNTDDIVPSTNFPLPLCHCYDVTGSAERRDFPPPNTGNLLQDLGLRLLGYHNWWALRAPKADGCAQRSLPDVHFDGFESDMCAQADRIPRAALRDEGRLEGPYRGAKPCRPAKGRRSQGRMTHGMRFVGVGRTLRY